MRSMTGWITSALLFAGLLSCAAAQESALVVGAVLSETGSHAAAAADYRKGLLLWTEEVNAAGGLLGRRIDLRMKDDGSEAARAGTADFLPQLYRAMGVQADAWIAFGEARDGAEMVKTLKRHGYVPRVFYLRAGAEPRFISLVGQDAEFILGSKEYDPRFPTTGN